MKNSMNIRCITLQLFGEGAGAGTGDGAGTGVEGQAAADQGVTKVLYGVQAEPQAAAAEAKPAAEEETFESLMKGKYKAEFDKWAQDTVRKRTKAMQGKADGYDRMAPLMQAMAERYGIQDATDIDSLYAAFDEDKAALEAEALDKGISLEEMRLQRRLERENKQLKQQMAEHEAAKQYSQWIAQAEDAKQFFPNLDIRQELGNEQFVSLLKSGIDVKTAYQVIHQNEIMPAMMQHSAEMAKQQVAASVAANRSRPSEGGMRGSAAAEVRADVSKLTKADMKEIERRVRNGERISFG